MYQLGSLWIEVNLESYSSHFVYCSVQLTREGAVLSNQIKSNQIKQLGKAQGLPIVNGVRYHEPKQQTHTGFPHHVSHHVPRVFVLVYSCLGMG